MRVLLIAGAAALAISAGAASHGIPADWRAAPHWLTLDERTIRYDGADADERQFVIRDFRGNEILSSGDFKCAYPTPLPEADPKAAKKSSAMTGTCVQEVRKVTPVSNGVWRVDYRCLPSATLLENGRPAILSNAYAIVTAGRDSLEIEYHVTAPQAARFTTWSRMMTTCVHVDMPKGVTVVKDPINSSYGKRPREGCPYEARGIQLRAIDLPDGARAYYSGASYAKGFGRKGQSDVQPGCLSLGWRAVDRQSLDEARREYMSLTKVMPATEAALAACTNRPAASDDLDLGEEGADIALNAAPPPPTDYGTGAAEFVATHRFQIVPWNDFDIVPACQANKQFLALSFATPAKLNLFDVTKGEKPEVTLTTLNPSAEPLTCDLRVQAWDWDGNVLFKEVKKTTWDGFGEKKSTYALPDDRVRDFFFVEASAVDEEGRECFTRTQLATLPPFEHRHRDTSFLGVQCDYPIPDYDTLGKLMVRMGVHWIRTWSKDVDWVGKWGMEVMDGFAWGTNKRGAARFAQATNVLARAHAHGATIVEVGGNEMNFPFKNKPDVVKMKRVIEDNVDWLKTFYEARYQMGLEKEIRLSTFGLAGSDYGFLLYMNAQDAFDYLDIVSLHPGRLCQVPDSHGPDWAWHYLSQIDVTRDFLLNPKVRGDRELGLVLTETYARTPPNARDSDSLRTAAENVLLSLVLAKTRDVYALIWYKSHDGAYWDVNGVNEYNSEYHYGLLIRDGTVKPSVLGWCAAAEMLDGAQFKCYRDWGDKRRCWTFSTPRGEAAVLVDRTDGEQPYPWDGFAGHKDPWVDHWKSFNDYTFAATGSVVKVVDTIGREKLVPVKGGRVTLRLSGSPVIVYGLDLANSAFGKAKRPPVRFGVRLSTDSDFGAATSARLKALGADFTLSDRPGAGEAFLLTMTTTVAKAEADFAGRVVPAAKAAVRGGAKSVWLDAVFEPTEFGGWDNRFKRAAEAKERIETLKGYADRLKAEIGGARLLLGQTEHSHSLYRALTNCTADGVFYQVRDWNELSGWDWSKGRWPLIAESKAKVGKAVACLYHGGPLSKNDLGLAVPQMAAFLATQGLCDEVVYDVFADPRPDRPGVGLVADGREKPAFAAFAETARTFRQADFLSRAIYPTGRVEFTYARADGSVFTVSRDTVVRGTIGGLEGVWRPLHDAKGGHGPYVNEFDVKREEWKGTKGLDEEPDPAAKKSPKAKKARPAFDMGVTVPDISDLADDLMAD